VSRTARNGVGSSVPLSEARRAAAGPASGTGSTRYERAPKHIVSGLIAKRACRRELAGIIAELEHQLARHRAELTHIDGMPRVLATNLDPETIKPKRIYRRTRYFARHELSRLCLNVLRVAAGEPVHTDFITEKVTEAKGFDPTDRLLRVAIADQVRSALKRLRLRRVVQQIGTGRRSTWKLVGA
jgi:hypothetical protein